MKRVMPLPRSTILRLAIICVVLLVANVARAGPSFVVAEDGSGNFETIQGAIDAMKSFPPERITLQLKNGVYREKVVVHEWNTRLTIVGEDVVGTVCVANSNFFA